MSSPMQPATTEQTPDTSGASSSCNNAGSSGGGGMSSSTLVETVNINYEDFNESFLTCSTCLCAYDQQLRRPKLLACSHTVCAQCLQCIVELPQAQDSGNFRCPICRELHQVPRGGVHCLPASFLVNQLIDLMQKQRRDVVPKCGAHPTEELLFCETCDTVFCQSCPGADSGGPPEQQGGAPRQHAPMSPPACLHNHTIVPFSIAIKRMSEILLYKANQCVRNLNRAAENVQREMSDLDHNVDRILDEVNASFQDLSQLMDSRRKELVEKVRETRDTKRKVLQDQLGIIQSEKAKVEQQCNGLQYQVEVRNITRRIADLNQKLDSTMTLVEPRENAFLRYDSTTKEVLQGIQRALAHFGQLSVSRTFPSLCTAVVDVASVHIDAHAVVSTIDYNGERRQSGGDPVEAKLTLVSPETTDDVMPPPGNRASVQHHAQPQRHSLLFVGGDYSAAPSPELDNRSATTTTSSSVSTLGGCCTELGHTVGVTVVDNDDGTYSLHYRAPQPGRYRLEVWIFGRQIKSSPMSVTVSAHHPPEWQFGSYGVGPHHLCQPVKVCSFAQPNSPSAIVYVLDTGNNRVRIINAADGTPLGSLEGDSLQQQSSVGLALAPSAGVLPGGAGAPGGVVVGAPVKTLLTLNWRTRRVSEWAVGGDGGDETRSFTFSEFVEPIDLAVDSRGRILVADNGAKKIFVFDTFYRPLFSFPVLANPKHQQNGTSNVIPTGSDSPSSPPHRRQQAHTLPPSSSLLADDVALITNGLGASTLARRTVRGSGSAGQQNTSPGGNVAAPGAALQSQVTCVAVGMNEDILVGGGSAVYLYDCAGCFVRTIDVRAPSPGGQGGKAPSSGGGSPPLLIGGVCVDRASGYILTTVSEGRGRTYVSVSAYKGGGVKYTLDSHGAKLRRPSGVCVASGGGAERNVCYVADLGNHCVKRYRFK